MSKPTKAPSIANESDAFEMIELAIDDLDALARAFDLITQVCAERNRDADSSSSNPEKMILN